jgi:hypothetical protein
MYSISFDYFFNRVYDVLLWIKYVWLFSILRTDPQVYIDQHINREWDGLRDRGWFNEYFEKRDAVVPAADTHLTMWQKMLETFGHKYPDSDGDGIPDISDSSPYDSKNLSQAQLKERYQGDYTFSDQLRDFFGIGPHDTDKDGVPNSYESAHGMNPNNPDSDSDGVLDGQELAQGTNPLNNDTDGDRVIDGRDEAPLDPEVTSLATDTDGDGVSDKAEGYLGSDVTSRDTDGDGIPDGMDAYLLDSGNTGQIVPLDVSKATEGLHFSVQNPVLSLFIDMLSVVAIVAIIFLVYASFRWFLTFVKALHDYDKHFSHGHAHSGQASSYHIIKHEDKMETKTESFPAGIANLPIHEETPSPPPTIEDFKEHPRFAIVQGYMSSQSEALWRIGIMEADNMLLDVLRDKGYQGEGVGEMLKSASFKTVELAWDAHKLRNRIAHEGSDFILTEREAKRVFTLFESVFRELKAIR